MRKKRKKWEKKEMDKGRKASKEEIRGENRVWEGRVDEIWREKWKEWRKGRR